MDFIVRLWRRPLSRLVATAMLLLTLGMGAMAVFHVFPKAQAASSNCQLNSAKGNIQHVIYIQFDNTHFTRDNSNVPSDLEQMPHLLNFIEGNGVLLTNHHTPLIAHTATDVLTSFIRPTMLALLGLKDDYTHDGRVLFENLEDWAVPQSLVTSRQVLTQLAQVYKKINAPVGELGLSSLRVSTKALESNDANDSTYTNLENQLTTVTGQRDSLASQMITMLDQAEFNNQPIDKQKAQQLIDQGNALLQQVNGM
jgi:hypothetical protein